MTVENSSTAPVILSVRDLDIKFNLRGRVLNAIRGISLDLYQGESLAIVGESGSGKSVFTKTFMGLLDQNGMIAGGRSSTTARIWPPSGPRGSGGRSGGGRLPWCSRTP